PVLPPDDEEEPRLETKPTKPVPIAADINEVPLESLLRPAPAATESAVEQTLHEEEAAPARVIPPPVLDSKFEVMPAAVSAAASSEAQSRAYDRPRPLVSATI